MEKFDISYSLKNIPTPSKDEYLKELITSSEHFIQRIRWRTHFFLNDSKNKQELETFGFKTPRNAPSHKELSNFESDISHLISNIEFEDNKSEFQKKLKKDIKIINNSKKLFVKADKTSNIYTIDKPTYQKLLKDNITTHYEKANQKTEKEINLEAKTITDKLKLSDRIEPIAHKNCFLTIKDHKPGFPNIIKCRLLNPTKSNIGKISKQILERINNEIRSKLKLQQWRCTKEPIEWLKALQTDNDQVFLQLDIEDFYPSISVNLFNKAIEFAKKTH